MTDKQETKHAYARSRSNDGLCLNTPWHVGFHTEIAETYQPDMARYEAWRVCENTGRHVAWVATREHAYAIVEAMNAWSGFCPGEDKGREGGA